MSDGVVALKDNWVARLKPSTLLTVLLTEFLLLALIFFGYLGRWANIFPFLDRANIFPDSFGMIPLGVPWAGALGGLSIALVGLQKHWQNWGVKPDEGQKWNAWYLLTTPLGAVFGTVAVLIIVLLLGTIAPAADGGLDVSAKGTLALAAVSFVVGFQQAVFRRLVTRATEVILAPGNPGATNEIGSAENEAFTVEPSILSFPVSPSTVSVAVTNAATTTALLQVRIEGPGFSLSPAPSIATGGGATSTIFVAYDGPIDKAVLGSLTLSVGSDEKIVSLSAGTAA